MSLNYLLLFTFSVSFWQCTSDDKQVNTETSEQLDSTEELTYYKVSVIQELPHDPNAFTQGFLVKDGFFYESTGIRGQSSLRKAEIATGNVIKQINLDPSLFGEGLVYWDGSFIQLTWQAQTALSYTETDTGFIANNNGFAYNREGWGLTENGTELIMSDGSSYLYFLNPETKKDTRSVQVTFNGQAINSLNELEYIDGRIYANIWLTEQIVIIEPETGKVEGIIEVDVEELLGSKYSTINPSRDVLNGIAYDVENNKMYITGKNWPSVFEIKLEVLSLFRASKQ